MPQELSRDRCWVEALDARTLLAGVTLLAHGYQGNINGWVSAAANGINERLGGEGSVYVMRVDEQGNRPAVTSFQRESGPDPMQSARAEYIVKVAWGGVNSGQFSTGEVGDVIADYLLTYRDDLRALVELPIHVVGHSRGASLTTAIARRLGERGVWVDHHTSLDPHPIDGDNDFLNLDFGDSPMRTWANVTFADNYWRDDGDVLNFDFDGEHVPGAHEGNLNDSVQQQFVGSAHIAVSAYYHGTVDLDAVSNGDHPVFDAWYGGNHPPRDETGYAFSRLGGRPRPTDGLRGEFGGAATRVSPGQSGAQWPNAADVQILGGSTTLAVGEIVKIRYKRQDRDSNIRVDLFLDRDQNPFNENNVRAIRRRSFGPDDAFTVARVNGSSAAVEPGRYWVYAKVSDDAGRTRYSYSRRITLVEPSQEMLFASVDGNGVLRVAGTAGDDVLSVTADGGLIAVRRGDFTQTFSQSLVQAIDIDAGSGHDRIEIAPGVIGVRANGAPGNDTLLAGTGGDSLFGSAGDDTFFARNSVADALDGGDGFDRAELDEQLDQIMSVEDLPG